MSQDRDDQFDNPSQRTEMDRHRRLLMQGLAALPVAGLPAVASSCNPAQSNSWLYSITWLCISLNH